MKRIELAMVAGDANIILGSTFEEGLDGRVRVSATGIESDQEVSWDPKGVDEVNLVNRENGAREDGAEVLSKREPEVELRILSWILLIVL